MTSTSNSCCQRAKVHRLVTQLGHLQMLCFGHVEAHFYFKALLYFRHLYYFSWDHVFQGAFSLQGALFYSGRFYFIQGAFILFRALYSSCIAPFYSCIALYSIVLCESALVYFFWLWVSALFYFLFKIVMQLLFQFLEEKRLSL